MNTSQADALVFFGATGALVLKADTPVYEYERSRRDRLARRRLAQPGGG